MGVKDILASYDEEIDELVDDARGYHDAVSAMRRDSLLEAQGIKSDDFDTQQVSQMAQQVDREADAEEGVPYGDDPEYSLEDLDALDAAGRPAEPSRRSRKIKLAIVVPACRRQVRVEVLQKGCVVAHQRMDPTRASRQIVLDVPPGKTSVRIVRTITARTINVRTPGRLDLRRR